jgi:hypothetical protein
MRDKNTKRSWPAVFVAAAALSVTLLGSTASAQVAVDSSTVADVYSDTEWANLPGAVIWATVPPGSYRLFLATFSAESACYGGPAGWCSVRIRIGDDYDLDLDEEEGFPISGADFAFDSNDGGTAGFGTWESHSMQRYRRISNPDSAATLWVPITVQRRTTDTTTSLRLDDWTLSVVHEP